MCVLWLERGEVSLQKSKVSIRKGLDEVSGFDLEGTGELL